MRVSPGKRTRTAPERLVSSCFDSAWLMSKGNLSQLVTDGLAWMSLRGFSLGHLGSRHRLYIGASKCSILTQPVSWSVSNLQ